MNNKLGKLKILTVMGTRPEIIRLSRVLPRLDEYFNHITVYSNQSYDYELSEIFFKELKLRNPDYMLEVKSDTIGQQIGKILSQTEQVILKEKPEALLTLGDTNTSLTAIIAKRYKIPIFHMEAGNRCFSFDVPEETNRALVDVISDFNLPYTQRGREYLIASGIHPSKIFVTGSPLREVYEYYIDYIESSSILEELDLQKNRYFIASFHREENVDDLKTLQELIDSFNLIADKYKLPIIVTLHPRTKKRMAGISNMNSLIKFHKPFGFFDYTKLQKNASCVLSDSGTIQEESSILRFCAVQIRTHLERPEAFENGAIILAGTHKNSISHSVEMATDLDKRGEKRLIPQDYQDGNVSIKVAKLILGLTYVAKYGSKSFNP